MSSNTIMSSRIIRDLWPQVSDKTDLRPVVRLFNRLDKEGKLRSLKDQINPVNTDLKYWSEELGLDTYQTKIMIQLLNSSKRILK